MKVHLLELHLSQLIFAWSKSKLNIYSDHNKELYHQQLGDLIHNLTKEDFSALTDVDLEIRKIIIDFIFKGIEFLDKSTLNAFPVEIVECLNVALNDWFDNDDYIIVTSLNNSLSSFSFVPSLDIHSPLLLFIKTKYGVEFKKRLIQINLPKSFSRDYFANVVLYHELGHFVDLQYMISESLARFLFTKYKDNQLKIQEVADLKQYFPDISNPNLSDKDTLNKVMRHLGEYFSDVFASQYIGECSNYYLDYITNSGAGTSNTHPSTINRIKLVNDFIEGNKNFIIDSLVDATQQITNTRTLTKRFNRIKSKNFLQLLPVEISHSNQLSSLYILGWELWQNYNQDFEKNNSMNYTLKASKRYEIINNLIEKSISNYIISESWNKAKHYVPN
jgi:hypothetical protein